MLHLVKTAPARRSYRLYSGDTPAAWALVDADDCVRARITGVCPEYSRRVLWWINIDGVTVREAYPSRAEAVDAARRLLVAQSC